MRTRERRERSEREDGDHLSQHTDTALGPGAQRELGGAATRGLDRWTPQTPER